MSTPMDIDITTAIESIGSTEAPPDFAWCMRYLTTITCISACVYFVGLVGNSMTIIVFTKSSKIKNGTTYILKNMATVDALICLVYIPSLFWLLSTVPMISMYTAYIDNIAYMLNQVSIFFTAILVWQRYLSVCKPISAKIWCTTQRLKVMTISAVTASVVIYFPQFFKYTLVDDGKGAFYAVETKMRASDTFFYAYTIVITNLVSYVAPMVVIVYATGRLIASLCHPMAEVSASSAKMKRDLTVSVIVVVILFLILQLPRSLQDVFQKVFHPYEVAIGCTGPLLYFGVVPPLSVTVNASVNFLVYFVCAKRFRKELLLMLCSRSNKVESAESQSATSTTDPSAKK